MSKISKVLRFYEQGLPLSVLTEFDPDDVSAFTKALNFG